jgi:magnesium-protoporphyrin IX monomethyl ester (oxidative) cyclase
MRTIAGAIDAAKKQGGVVGGIKRAGLIGAAAVNFVRLYLTPVKRNEAPAIVRMVPAW